MLITLTHHYRGHDKNRREFTLSKMKVRKEKYWNSFWNIINNEIAFYYQFEGGYMDEADILGRVAQWDSM